MTNALKDMSVSEAVNVAFQLMIYGEWDNQEGYSHRTVSEGSFEDYLAEYTEDEELDSSNVWESMHYGKHKGTRDGWTAEVVESYGGEGQGDQYWMVISITDGTTTRYFRKDGWYSSYDGGYLDGDTHEVKPQERLVTFYE